MVFDGSGSVCGMRCNGHRDHHVLQRYEVSHDQVSFYLRCILHDPSMILCFWAAQLRLVSNSDWPVHVKLLEVVAGDLLKRADPKAAIVTYSEWRSKFSEGQYLTLLPGGDLAGDVDGVICWCW